jgi:hypothetical protein
VSQIITPFKVLEPNVPQGYNKRLKQIHRGLYFKWNAGGGLTGRWEIWWKNDNTGKDSHAITVGNGVYYKPLTEEVFQILRRGDSHNIGVKAVIAIAEEQDRLAEEARQKEIERIAEEALRDEAQMHRLTQKPIGVRTEKEYQKPKGRLVG